jgi:hypothetical protein
MVTPGHERYFLLYQVSGSQIELLHFHLEIKVQFGVSQPLWCLGPLFQNYLMQFD